MPSKAKAKGNAFEREVAKHFSKIFGENFMRVPTSGAFTGGANVWRMDEMTADQKRMMDGDIMVPPCLSKWKFECKSYKELDFHAFYKGSKQLDKWIKQAESDDLWCLLIKVTRKGKYVVFPKKFHGMFEYGNYTAYDKYIIANYDNFFESNCDLMKSLNEERVDNTENKVQADNC